MSARILCGPVVGLVNEDSVIVLLEIDRQQSVAIALSEKGRVEPTNTVRSILPARRPRAFKFTDLNPDTKYYITIEDVAPAAGPRGCVRTLPRDPQKVKVGVLSCDYPERETRVNMWKKLYHKAKSEHVHVILHVGDNVYMDGDVSEDLSNQEQVRDSAGIFDAKHVDQAIPYVRARRLLHGLTCPADWDTKREEILEIYRERYRYTWGLKYTALVLMSFSNLMILDDHEIRDDFGLLEEDGDPETVEFWLGTLAIQVYHEYQRQLWDPDIVSTDKNKSLFNEFYTIRLGPLAIAMMDVRTSMSVYKPRRQPGDNSYYGNEQMTSFKELFSDEGHDTRMWLLCCALPLVFFKRKINKLLKKLDKTQDDLDAFIKRGQEDLRPIWKAIRDWKHEKGPSSDVMVLAGDVHLGGFTDIFCAAHNGGDNSELLCHQVTTSPIHNKTWNSAQYDIGKIVLETCTDKFDDITYHHFDWVNSCNFAIIRVDFRNPEKVMYDVSLNTETGRPVYKRSADGPWYRPSAARFFRNLFCVRST